MTAPDDHDARERTISRRDRSLLVEASAGTGKTHAIIDVIAEIAVRREPRVPLSRIAATTFTEKAAGELEARLRAKLAELAGSADERTRAAALESLEELERAQVGTIHGFCSAILRERPIEAGLIPEFTLILPEASAAFARRTWEEWWRQEIEERPGGALGRALVAGMRIDGGDKEWTIGKLAAALYEERLRLDGAELPAADAAPLRRDANALKERAGSLRRAAIESGNPAATTLSEIIQWLDALPDDLAGIRAMRSSAPKIRFKSGWVDDAIDAWREDAYKPFLKSLPGTVHWPMMVDLLRRLASEPGGFLDSVARQKRKESLLDFDDLLLFTRDLLRRSAAARAHFRDRYALIVVDEFQDTDPVQMEIFLRLAHAEGGGEDWKTLAPEPGRLLLVGDPKQSIYRFRRADLESYGVVRNLMGEDREIFVANRRSVAPILAWVNAVFRVAMPAPATRPFDAPYSPLSPWGVRPDPREKRVVYLDPPDDWRAEREERWRDAEAEAIAAFLAGAIRGKTLTLDREAAASAGDVAVLVRSNDAIGPMQEALARAGLESVLEGGRDFFRREEPAAVLSALAAIDNPDEQVALYAALKSFLFAFSDEELFLASEAGARFDYRRAGLAPGELGDALALFERLHRRRESRPVSETVADLYEATGALVKARARPAGGLQAEANLHQLRSLARALESSSASFGDAIRGLQAAETSEASEPRAFEESTNAVRLLTVHKAKGLEFPVVVLAGFGGERPPATTGLLIPRREGPWGAAMKLGGDSASSPDYDAIRRAESERAEAETRRLLYVAATRSKDWFVLSRWRKVVDGGAGLRDSYERTALAALGPLVPGPEIASLVERVSTYPGIAPRSPRRSAPNKTAAEALSREIAAISVRASLLEATRSDRLRRAGGSHARAEDEPAAERSPAASPSVAARVGCAVHRAMERIVRGAEPPAAVAAAALEWELGPERRREIAGLVDTLLRSPLVLSSARRLTELPVLYRSPEDGALVEGKIDLLVQEEKGWTIVDYKTDRVGRLVGPEAVRAHFEAYRPQLREYAAALSLLGIDVVRGCVISARSGEVFDLLGTPA